MIKPTKAENTNQNFLQFTEEEYNQIRVLLGKNQFCGNVTGNLNPKCYTVWIIDSGANDHISFSSNLLHHTPYYNIVCLPNGSHIDTLFVGIV